MVGGGTLVNNKIWMTPEGKGLDHAAVQPHTAGRLARSCESCHNNPKTLGYGIEDGRFLMGYENDLVVDLETNLGQTIPRKFQVQSPSIPELDHDLSQIVTRDGQQPVSVSSHWPLTSPLSAATRAKMERTGLCMGCHQNMLDENLWAKVNTPAFVDNEQHRGGSVLEMECEQYVSGFTDLYLRAGLAARNNLCLPPEGNRADEVRWANENFDKRDMPAVDGLIATLKCKFKCK
jgi:hypothetical protein